MAYAPTTVNSTDINLQHIADVIYHDKNAVDNLKANCAHPLVFNRKKKLPKNAGKTIRLFERYPLFTYNTTPWPEGTIGSGKSYSTTTLDATITQYGDWMSFSDVLMDTAITDEMDGASGEFGYQAALTVDELCKTQLTTLAAADATACIDLGGGATPVEYFSGSTARRARFSLEALNAKPFEAGRYKGIIHPLVAYDFFNDNTAGGVMDILKRNDYDMLKRGIQGYKLFTLDGIDWVTTTRVSTTASYDSGSGTAYHSWVVGDQAAFMISLGSTDIPDQNNFHLMIKRYPNEPTQADPINVIRGTIGYKFYFASCGRPDSLSPFRRIRSLASIT